MKTILKFCITSTFSIIGLLIAILLCEIIVRIFFQPHSYTNFYKPHEQFGRFFIPGQKGWYFEQGFETYIEINSQGLRDEEHYYEKPDSVFRILLLGDSFGVAFQVPLEDTFHKVAQRLLIQSARGHRFEIINGSFPGWGTVKELLFYEVEGYKYEPDLVLLVFFPGNDVLDNAQMKKVEQKQSKKLPTRREIRADKMSYDIKVWLTKNSRLYTFVNRRLKSGAPLWFLNFLQRIGVIGSVRPLVKDHIPSDYLVYATEYNQDWENTWKITKDLIIKLKSDVENHNANFGVVIITDREQVHPDRWQEAVSTYPAMKDREWDLDKPNRLLTDFLKSKYIPYLDLLPLFRIYANENRVYLHYHYDNHWNVQGHHLAGELIYNWLVENKLFANKKEVK